MLTIVVHVVADPAARSVREEGGDVLDVLGIIRILVLHLGVYFVGEARVADAGARRCGGGSAGSVLVVLRAHGGRRPRCFKPKKPQAKETRIAVRFPWPTPTTTRLYKSS